MMNSLRKNSGQGDTIEGISCDGDDDTARCSHCRIFSLSVHNLLAVQKHLLNKRFKEVMENAVKSDDI